MIAALREFLALSRAAQVELCVRVNEWEVERAKRNLADALDARDRLRAEQAIANHAEREQIPQSLLRSKP